MSAHFALGQEGETIAERSESPGRRLRLARQAQGLELDYVASELHLSPTMIQSLEHDDYDALPGHVFVVGYIRKYARVVGLDPEPLLASYQAAAPQAEPVGPRIAPRAADQSVSGHHVVRLVGVGILILLTFSALVWWQGQQPSTDVGTVEPGLHQEAEAGAISERAPEPQTPASPGRDLIAVPAGSRLPELELQVQTSQPEKPPVRTVREQRQSTRVPPTGEAVVQGADNSQIALADTGSAVAEQNADELTVADEDGVEPTAVETGEVVMSFDGPCWVDVRDSERNYKLFGEMKKGDRHVLDGKPPYSVILGNAAAVRITVGGATFDLSGISQGNVARFTLDPDETP